MINEYLFSTNENKMLIEEYRPENITIEISEIEHTPLWIVTYSLPNKNEDSAKKLSEVHNTIMQYSPLVLSCESSEYYNRILFPMVNELERKLRKLLYLAASISGDEKDNESIKKLEEKDFGEIFDLLFIDQTFITELKKKVNAVKNTEFEGKTKYSKTEINTYLDGLVENTLWDKILSENDVATLRNRFRDVQQYRNDVMHAHNISREVFGKEKYLFEKINKELDIAIGGLLGITEDKPESINHNVNEAISTALAAMDYSDIIQRIEVPTVAMEQFTQALKNVQPLGIDTTFANRFKELDIATINPELAQTLSKMNALVNSPSFTAMSKALEPLQQVLQQYSQLNNITKLTSAPYLEENYQTEDEEKDE